MEYRKDIRFRRQEAEAISDPLINYVKTSGLYQGLLANKLSETWDSVSGAGRYTINKYLKNNVLYVSLSSSALRNKLQAQVPSILKKINDALLADSLYSGTVISKIILK